MRLHRLVLESLWEDKYLTALMAVKFIFAALFINEIYTLDQALNEEGCRYAVKFAKTGLEQLAVK